MKIKVRLYCAVLLIEERETNLTLKVAKQFPILPVAHRQDQAVSGHAAPDPICKVRGATLGRNYEEWLYLVQDETAGLAWVAPACFREDYAEKVVEGGGWVDHPASVPTVIL